MRNLWVACALLGIGFAAYAGIIVLLFKTNANLFD
jgi:hypothetical protein